MNMYTLISKAGSGIAAACILFLPVVGCGGENINGIELLQHKDIWTEVKIFIGLAILCGVVALFTKKPIYLVIAAIAGIVSLVIGCLIAHGKNEAIELKIGSFLSLMSYAVSAVVAFLGFKDTLQTNVNQKNQSS